MKVKFILPFLFLFFITDISFAQNWAEKMQSPTGNFYDIKADFEQYWLTHDKTEKGKGYKAFKRWENFVERRVYPTGDLSLLGQTAKNYDAFLKQQSHVNPIGKVIGNGGNLIASATWTPMGLFGAISGNAGSQLLKAGRIGFITIDPTNTLNLWVGAPAGGLWQSTNGGASWTTNTDNLSVIGCSDLAIDPTNTSIMYLATGDGDAGDTRSIGILKSTNGGVTWNTTGLINAVTNNFLIRKLIINPSNTQILIAATNAGIYRTTNGGANWTQVITANSFDVEFKPGNPSTVYSCGTSFRVSTDGGATFTQINSGIPITGVNRMAIAVTPDDANYVYVLASNSTNSGFLGLYRSTVSGTVFSVMSTTPNILDGSTLGNGTGGQGWYDLCIAASPLNKDEVVTGGVNVWKSLDGGSTWTLYGHWTGSGGAPFTHADQHDLEYAPNGILFNTNDGTVYKRPSGATTWTEISGTMNISQIYRIGMSSLTANKWITGHQDNGTSIWNGTTYSAKLGGDGMDCFYDRNNDNNVFGSYQNGALNKSTNGGTSWAGCTSGLSGTAPWLTVWKQDPLGVNTLYCGYTDLFISTNLGNSWSQLTAIPGGGTINEFAIAPSNNQVIYLLKNGGIYKSINGGSSWSNVTGTVPIGTAAPQYVAIDPADPNNAWVVLSGYSAANKVFVTANGGASWTNYTANLPNLPVNCCVYQPGTSDRIYIGMDVGIYYRDNISASWTLYNAGLPNVPVSELQISPASPTLLHAATYGRGVWVASLIPSSALPVSNFSIPVNGKCVNATVTFSDQSANGPTSWSWSVSPSAGVFINSPTSQNPVITFPSGGNYTVSMQSTNINGPGSISSQTVLISNYPTVSVTVSSQAVCIGSPVSFTASGATNYTWSNGGGNASTAIFYPAVPTVYTVTGSTNGCAVSKVVSVSPNALPIVVIGGTTTVCSGNSAVLIASGASSYTWNTSATGPIISVSPVSTSIYSVSGTGINGCDGSASKTITALPLPIINITATDSTICAGDLFSLNADGADNYSWIPGNQSGNLVSFITDSTTTYICTGSDTNGCMNSSAFTVTVELCEGIAKSLLVDKNIYTVYPNPTRGKLTVKTGSANSSAITLTVTDASGKIVFNQHLVFSHSDKAFDINISHLAAGPYFLKLSSKEGGSDLVKIIKE